MANVTLNVTDAKGEAAGTVEVPASSSAVLPKRSSPAFR